MASRPGKAKEAEEALAPEAGLGPLFLYTGQEPQQGTQSSRSQPGSEGPLPGGLGKGQEGAMLCWPYPRMSTLASVYWGGYSEGGLLLLGWEVPAGGAWYPT